MYHCAYFPTEAIGLQVHGQFGGGRRIIQRLAISQEKRPGENLRAEQRSGLLFAQYLERSPARSCQ